MSILDKQYITTMKDGSEWAVPVRVIAENRARYYWKGRGEFSSLEQSLSEDTVPLFESCDFEIEDWAQNNMSWIDVREHATQIEKAPEPDYHGGWINGEHRIE